MRAPNTEGHAHHWLIAAAEGETTPAVCKTCGAARVFRTGYRESGPKALAKRASVLRGSENGGAKLRHERKTLGRAGWKTAANRFHIREEEAWTE